MQNVVRIESKRKAEGKDSTFCVRGESVDPSKIDRHKKRNNVSEIPLFSQLSPAARKCSCSQVVSNTG